MQFTTISIAATRKGRLYLSCKYLSFLLILPITDEIIRNKIEINLLIDIDGSEHAVSMYDKKTNPLKYFNRTINESKSNSLKNISSVLNVRICK